MHARHYLVILGLIFFVILFSCQKTADSVPDPDPGPPGPGTGTPDLPAVAFDYVGHASNIPAYIKNYINTHPGSDNTTAGNPLTNNGATLGRVLFYDKSLSVNNTIACASCHHADKSMVDGVAFSKGFNDGLTRRNSMPLLNLRFFPAKKMFWDMRAADLETQVLMPIQDLVEMGIPNLAELVAKLKTKAYYPELFNKAFGSADITEEKISKALSQFLRSMVALNSKYDQGFDNGHANLSVAEKAGLQKVIQLSCTECHSDFETHIAKNPIFLPFENSGENIFGFGTNNGLDLVYTDNGIGEKTNKPGDMATFKMPSLRNVELTAPYMHDGRFATLEQVLTHYQTGVKNHPNRGIQIPNNGYRAAISDQDKANIIAFLKTLTDGNIVTDPKFSNPFK